jgi:hypothetical protein
MTDNYTIAQETPANGFPDVEDRPFIGLLATPPGTGKTTEAWSLIKRHLAAHPDNKVVVLTAHALNTITGRAYVAEKDPELVSLCMTYESRNKDENNAGYCAKKDQCDKAARKGYLPRAKVCQKCPIYEACLEKHYLSQESKAQNARLLLIRHEHVRNMALLENRTLIVIDECPLDVMEKPLTYTVGDLQARLFTDIVLPGYNPERDEPELLAAHNQLNRLLGAFRQALTNVPQPKKGPKKVMLGGMWFVEQVIYALGSNKADGIAQIEAIYGSFTSKILRSFNNKYTEDQSVDIPTAIIHLVKAFNDDFFTQYCKGRLSWNSLIVPETNAIQLYAMDEIVLPSSAQILICDATGDVEKYKRAFVTDCGEPFELVVFDTQLAPKHKHTVIRGGNLNSKSSIRAWDENDSVAVRRFKEYARILYERHKGNILFVVSGKALLEEKLTPWIKGNQWKLENWTYYGAAEARGTNKWQHLEAILLFGTPIIPPHELEKLAQIWHWKEATLSFEHKPVVVPYSGYIDQDGNGLGYLDTMGYADPRIEHMRIQLIQAEMWQAAGRIRPDTSTAPRYIYSLTEMPYAPIVHEFEDGYIAPVDGIVRNILLGLPINGQYSTHNIVQKLCVEGLIGLDFEGQKSTFLERTVRESCKRVFESMTNEGLGRIELAYRPGVTTGRPSQIFVRIGTDRSLDLV